MQAASTRRRLDPPMSRVSVTLAGGSPWGFRIEGGRGTGRPLRLSKVNPGSKAEFRGLREGDVLRTVSGHCADDLSQTDVQDIIEEAGTRLALEVDRKPVQRHSMYEEPDSPYVAGGLSSSSSTLPSVAGSVDRLTDSEEKKRRKRQKKSGFFFGPSSFSLGRLRRSTSSVVVAAAPPRRDSSSQTDRPPGCGEIGVQTHNAPTVDVPVQTGFDEWEDDARTRSFPPPPSSFHHRPGRWWFPRGPVGLRSAGQHQPSLAATAAPAPKFQVTGATTVPRSPSAGFSSASAPKLIETEVAFAPGPAGARFSPASAPRVTGTAATSVPEPAVAFTSAPISGRTGAASAPGTSGAEFSPASVPEPAVALTSAPKSDLTGALSAPGTYGTRFSPAWAPILTGTGAASAPGPCSAEAHVTPLDASRVPRYTSPRISATDASEKKGGEPSSDAPSAAGAGRDAAAATCDTAPSPNAGVTSGIGDQFNSVDVNSPIEQNPDLLKQDSIPNPDSTTTSGKKSTAGPQQRASAKLVNFSPPPDKPSALKIERTDSPVRHSAKIKTVHFDLSDSDSSESNNNIKEESSLNIGNDSQPVGVSSRNLDKDFEDLLRNLDIIVNDRVESPENPSANDLKISFSSFQKSPPKQTLLSTKLKSAFDALLPPIAETYENCEVDLSSDVTTSNEIHSESEKGGEQITKINPLGELVEEELVNKLPTPTSTVENNSKISKDDSEKSTSAEDVFTSSKSELFVLNDGNRENVYENGIKENVLKTVTLPTLPSFFDSAPNSSSEPPPSVSPPLEADSSAAELTQLDNVSENEDRMSSTSNSRGSDPRSNSSKTFENLEQLEEEIIRSLGDPCGSDEGFRRVPAPPTESPDHARIRRGVLDRLLHRGGGAYSVSEEGIGDAVAVPASEIDARQTCATTAAKFEASDFLPELIGSPSSGVVHVSPRIPRVDAAGDAASDTGKIHSPPKNSAFYIPEHKPSSTGVPECSPASDLTSAGGTKDKSDFSAGKDVREYEGTCDFAPCLRPSEIRKNSPFLDAIISRSSPEKSRSRSPPEPAPESEVSAETNPDGRCDFTPCLEPAQNGGALSETSAGGIPRTPESSEVGISRIPECSDERSPVLFECPCDRIPRDKGVSHTSEVTIVLQTPPPGNGCDRPGEAEIRKNPSGGDETAVEIGPLYSAVQKASPLHHANRQIPSTVVTPIPPPPPPTTSGRDSGSSSSETGPRPNRQSSHLSMVVDRGPPKPKSPVMSELELRFQARRKRDQGNDARTDLCDRNVEMKSGSSHENSFVSPTSATTTIYEASRPREHAGNGLNGRQQHFYSPAKTSITAADVAPRGGAVVLLLEECVTGRHTDRHFGLPVREVLRETTTTATFVPAPPKYDGIGPLDDDGLPLAPRNSVKKENMHNWYKTMFKSLHKADLPNDNQEYIIGYSSEPETSQKEGALRKKSSTLDSRAGSGKAKDDHSCSSRQSPHAAKSSVGMYGAVRPIEDYEPGHSSVTDDDEITAGYKRFLPSPNAPKTSYEFKNGYEPDTTSYTRNLSPSEGRPDPAQQKVRYREVQSGGEVPRFGLGKPAPDRPADPVIGPLPPPPTNYSGPTVRHQATRPLALPASYHTDNGLCQQQQSDGPFEMQMRHILHTELQQQQHRRQHSPTSSNQLSAAALKSPSSRSPDLKVSARALFDFRAESSREVSLRRGDVVLIARQLDGNWYEGESRVGAAGIFPVNYVEIVPPETTPPAKSFSHGSGKVLYDFTAHASVELSVRKGDVVSLLRRVDANWYEARRGEDATGIVPASYLQVRREPAEKRTPSPKPCLKSPRNGTETIPDAAAHPPGRSRPPDNNAAPATSDGDGRGKPPPSSRVTKSSGGLIEPVMYTALYGYSPLNSDELELEEGDAVCVVEKCDDGWYVGTSARTGRFGIFPGNYVHRT